MVSEAQAAGVISEGMELAIECAKRAIEAGDVATAGAVELAKGEAEAARAAQRQDAQWQRLDAQRREAATAASPHEVGAEAQGEGKEVLHAHMHAA